MLMGEKTSMATTKYPTLRDKEDSEIVERAQCFQVKALGFLFFNGRIFDLMLLFFAIIK